MRNQAWVGSCWQVIDSEGYSFDKRLSTGFGIAIRSTMKKTVQVFHSFAGADAADAIERLKMTPQERVDIFFELREREHPDAFKQGLERVYRVPELERS